MPCNSAGEGVLGGPAEDVTTLSGSRSRSQLISFSIDFLQKTVYSWHTYPSDRTMLRVKSGRLRQGLVLFETQGLCFMSLLNLVDARSASMAPYPDAG